MVYGNKVTVYSCTIYSEVKKWGKFGASRSVQVNNNKKQRDTGRQMVCLYGPEEYDWVAFVGPGK